MWRSNIDHMTSRCTDMGKDRIMVVKKYIQTAVNYIILLVCIYHSRTVI